MTPTPASTAAPAKAGAFDIASLFSADKAATAEAATTLATLAKKEGVEFFGSIGFNDAIVKVSPAFWPTPWAGKNFRST